MPKTVEPGHNDGYGVLAFRDGAMNYYYRTVESPEADANLPALIDILSSMDADLVMGHLRKATKGKKEVVNNQPFVKDNFGFATNGTVNFPGLGADENDSQYFFDKIITDGTEATLAEISNLGYTSATFILTDGKKLSAARWFNEQFPNAKELDFDSYYTLYKLENEDFRIFASEVTPSLRLLEADPILLGNQTAPFLLR